MAEGFFHPERCPDLPLPAQQLAAALVRVLPRTVLHLDWAGSADEARERARNEARPDGSECWYRYFTREDAQRIGDPQFSMGMVRCEFARHLAAGKSLPAEVLLDGGGSGFAVTARGHVLTNFHLVTSEVGNHRREAGCVNVAARCRTLRVQVARRTTDRAWRWNDVDDVWLVSNPPQQRAIVDQGDNTAALREDTALLRVAPAPSAHLPLARRAPELDEPVWLAGFPLRSARAAAAKAALGYDDADGSLRVSRGQVTQIDGDYFTTDCDGSMGNSGSPVIDRHGAVLGLFSRATGDGPRNAFEYGHLQRVQVAARLAIEGLRLDDIEGWPG